MTDQPQTERENLKCILIDQFSDMDAEAIAFWECLDSALQADGYALAMTHYPESQDHTDLPLVWTNYDACWTYSKESFGAPRIESPEDIALVKSRAADWGLRLENDDHAAAIAAGCNTYVQALLDYFEPDLVVIWNGFHIQQEFLARHAKARGLTVWHLEKAPLPGWLHIDPDGILEGSRFGATRLQDIPDMTETGNSELSYLRTLNAPTWYEQPTDKEEPLLSHGVGADQHTLVFFGQIDNDTQNFAFSPHFSSNPEAWHWFLDATETLGDGYFRLGKHHPLRGTSITEYYSNAEARAVWTNGLSMSDAIKHCNGIASVNSSAMFEGLISGKPVLSVGGQSVWRNKEVMYYIAPDMSEADIQSELDAWILDSRKEIHSRNLEQVLKFFLAEFAISLDPDIRSNAGLSIDAVSQLLINSARSSSSRKGASQKHWSSNTAFEYLNVHASRSAFQWQILSEWESQAQLNKEVQALRQDVISLQKENAMLKKELRLLQDKDMEPKQVPH